MIGELRILHKSYKNEINPYQLVLGREVITIRFVKIKYSALGLKVDIFSYQRGNFIHFSREEKLSGIINSSGVEEKLSGADRKESLKIDFHIKNISFDEYKEALKKYLKEEYFKEFYLGGIDALVYNMKTVRMLFKLGKLMEAKKVLGKMKKTPEIKMLLFYIENKKIDKNQLMNLITSLGNEISIVMYLLEYMEYFTVDEFKKIVNLISTNKMKVFLYLKKLESIREFMEIENYEGKVSKIVNEDSSHNNNFIDNNQTVSQNKSTYSQINENNDLTSILRSNSNKITQTLISYEILQISQCPVLERKMIFDILRSIQNDQILKMIRETLVNSYCIDPLLINYHLNRKRTTTGITIESFNLYEFDVIKTKAGSRCVGKIKIRNPLREMVEVLQIKIEKNTVAIPVFLNDTEMIIDIRKYFPEEIKNIKVKSTHIKFVYRNYSRELKFYDRGMFELVKLEKVGNKIRYAFKSDYFVYSKGHTVNICKSNDIYEVEKEINQGEFVLIRELEKGSGSSMVFEEILINY